MSGTYDERIGCVGDDYIVFTDILCINIKVEI